ncbi:hypothetical protein QQ045_004394 [Rhodiola kirilowii]
MTMESENGATRQAIMPWTRPSLIRQHKSFMTHHILLQQYKRRTIQLIDFKSLPTPPAEGDEYIIRRALQGR